MRLFRRSVIPLKTIICTGLTILLLAFPAARPCSAAPETAWQSPAENLADQIAGALRTGPAHFTLQNISSITAENVPAIRRKIEQLLKTRGIALVADETAPAIRVTLSDNARERLWIAEITRNGNTKVVMVPIPLADNQSAASAAELTLHRQAIATAPQPILAGLETPSGFLALEPEQLVLFSGQNPPRILSFNLPQTAPVSRDPRGILVPSGPNAFRAWLPGIQCEGPYPEASSAGDTRVQCTSSDDPWPITASENSATPALKAFYDSNRDFFTGITIPAQQVELPAFYTASPIPRAGAEPPLLLIRADNKAMLLDNGQLRPVNGSRDWGSDFALLVTGCGQGSQAIVSSPDSDAADILRAYNIAGSDAAPASAPLSINGSVIAIWPAQDSKSVFATIRNPLAPGTAETYEVDRVTATCN